MARGSRLTVRVVAVPSGEMVLGFGRVTVFRGREPVFQDEFVTEVDGLGAISRAVPPGTYDVEVRLGGWPTGTGRVVVEAPDDDPTVEVRVRHDEGQGVAAIRCGFEDDGRPGEAPFHALVRRVPDDVRVAEDGAWRKDPWRAVPCEPQEPNLLRLGPTPAGVYEVLVWTKNGEVGHAYPVRVASDRVEGTSMGFHEGTRVDLARDAGASGPAPEIVRKPDTRIVAVVGRDGRHLPLVRVAEGELTRFDGDVAASTRLGPYPNGVSVQWRVGEGETESTWVR
jgi:hypothetical protein